MFIRSLLLKLRFLVISMAVIFSGTILLSCFHDNGSDNGNIFSTADLEGTWNTHILASGDAPQWNGWTYGPVSINGSGGMVWTSVTRSDGDSSLNPPDTLYINSGVVVSSTSDPAFQGVISQDKNTIVGTFTGGGGEYSLIIFQKSGASFSTADLEGTWNTHILASGDAPQWNGWTYGPVSINGSGGMVWTSVTRSDGDSSLNPPDTLSIASSGVVSSASDPAFQGVMSQDKNTIVGTFTGGGGEYSLIIFQK